MEAFFIDKKEEDGKFVGDRPSSYMEMGFNPHNPKIFK
jgi:hypothetical protein